MTTALFHNFTATDFTGYWDGKPYTFRAGAKKFLPRDLAEHFAKHLANRELLLRGDEKSTSPKKPEDVPTFFEIYSRACTVQDGTDGLDDMQQTVDIMNRERSEPSMNLPESNQPIRKPTVVVPPDFDSEDSDFHDDPEAIRRATQEQHDREAAAAAAREAKIEAA